MNSWSQFWKKHPKNCVHTHICVRMQWFRHPHPDVDIQCRHLEMHAHAKCLDCKGVGCPVGRSEGHFFQGHVLQNLRFKVLFQVKILDTWSKNLICMLSNFVFRSVATSFIWRYGTRRLLRFKVLFQVKILDTWSKDLICMLSNFIFRSVATSLIWRCSVHVVKDFLGAVLGLLNWQVLLTSQYLNCSFAKRCLRTQYVFAWTSLDIWSSSTGSNLATFSRQFFRVLNWGFHDVLLCFWTLHWKDQYWLSDGS